MKHSSSREMFRYWTELRLRRSALSREELDPVALRKILGDSIILSFDRGTGHPVRLAGTRVCALFGRELKASPFISLWDTSSRQRLQRLIAIVSEQGAAMVASAAGQTPSHASVPVEMLLLPPSGGRSPDDRIIGVLAPLGVPSWIGLSPIEALSLSAFRPALSERPPVSDRLAPPRGVRSGVRFVAGRNEPAEGRAAPGLGTVLMPRTCTRERIGSRGRPPTPDVNVVYHKFGWSRDRADE